MTAKVRILPTGHEFSVEGNESILDAALRAGLAMGYGCSNGNCGLCLGRVMSGEVRKIRHHDYILSAAEKAARRVLLCSNTAAIDAVIEAPEAHGARDIPRQQITAKVRGMQRLSTDIMLLHLQTPRSKRLQFLAGQHVSLGLGGGLVQDHPIASCPCDDRNLYFHIPRVPADPFADYIYTRLKNGADVAVDGPTGDFTLRGDASRPLLFVACEHGFAPIKSLLEQAMAHETGQPLHLYWIARREDGHYARNLCRSWADALDNFHFTPLPAPDDLLPVGVAEGLPEPGKYDVYVAGPEPMVGMAERFLLDRGCARRRLLVDRLR